MISAVVILLAFVLAGDVATRVFGIPLTPPLIGMVLLLVRS